MKRQAARKGRLNTYDNPTRTHEPLSLSEINHIRNLVCVNEDHIKGLLASVDLRQGISCRSDKLGDLVSDTG